MKTLVLIDGDELVYKAGFASQYAVHSVINKEDKTLVSTHATKQDAIESIGDDPKDQFELDKEVIARDEAVANFALDNIFEEVFKNTEATDYRIYLTGTGNFREEVATLLPYKGNREEGSRPAHYEYIKQRLLDRYCAKVIDGMEADDALSITQWSHLKVPRGWNTIIASQDKDLKMVPGLHYNPTTKKTFEMHPLDARLWFYTQLLVGDPTDNIPGIYRTGVKTASKVLSELRDFSDKLLFDTVETEYYLANKNPKLRERTLPKTRDDIVEVARLLWMLQEEGQVWDYWEPYYDY